MTTYRNGDVCTIEVVVDSVIFEASGVECIRVKVDGETHGIRQTDVMG